MTENHIEMTVPFVQCPSCKDPLIIVDGEVQNSLTFWWRNDYPVATGHIETCQYRGQKLP